MSAGRMVGSLVGSFGGRALGGMLGGSTGRMVGSMVGAMLGGRGSRGGLGGISGGLGGLLGGLGGGDDDEKAPADQMDDEQAMIIIRAMTNAAKADGTVDQSEIDAIIERAGDLDDEEQEILRNELNAPLDLDDFIDSVPSGMEADVYAASMLPIEVDTVAEAEYLRNLAAGLGLEEDQIADIHDALGVK